MILTPTEARRDLRRSGYLRHQIERAGGDPDRLAGLSAERILETLRCMQVSVAVAVGSVSTMGSGGTSVSLPTDNLIGHYLAHEGVTYDSGGTEKVSDWNDQHSSVNHLTQGTAGNQPVRVDAVLDGRPIIRFSNSHAIFRAGLTGGSRGAVGTVYLIAKKANTSESPSIMIVDGPTGTNYGIQANGAKWGNRQDSLQSETNGTADTDWHVLCSVFDATDELFVDGTSVVDGNAGTQTSDGVSIGRSSFGSSMDVAGVFIYDGVAHDSDQRDAVTAYAKSLWPSLP